MCRKLIAQPSKDPIFGGYPDNGEGCDNSMSSINNIFIRAAVRTIAWMLTDDDIKAKIKLKFPKFVDFIPPYCAHHPYSQEASRYG